jgi:hypothetical protein
MSGAKATTSAPPKFESMDTAPITEDVLSTVLECYSYKGCRYLIDAEYGATHDSLLANGNFTIGDSAYIRNSGHFNAAEMVICFSQLMYCALAQGTANKDISAFHGWSIDDYYKIQLPGILIKSTSSVFRRPINPRQFSARFQARDFRIIERTCRYLQFQSTIKFWDKEGGAATSEYEIAVLDIP